MAADWSLLPRELLIAITRRLHFLDDAIAFGAVCRSWHLAMALGGKPSLPPKCPLLLSLEEYKTVSIFAFPFNSKVRIVKSLPETTSRLLRCVAGAGFGALVIVAGDSKASLWHPFSKSQIHLPPNPISSELCSGPKQPPFGGILNFGFKVGEPGEVSDALIRKAVLSSNPWKSHEAADRNGNSCVIMAIFSEALVLAFARVGDKAWTKVQLPSCYYQDIICYKSRFYAVDRNGFLFSCSVDDDRADEIPVGQRVVAHAPIGTSKFYDKYLVESLGDLFLILRIRHFSDHSKKFRVLKLEERVQEESHECRYTWAEVNELGDRALFV
ncbi:F-box protein SKIP23-like [Malania oleifera]|uniref:F-box protein SKIP23-like n=1 Tax=Malania oleifera TaxID=397392 RepID=UPI0025AE603F|nr:F-box protein SKIP23-like [Malania oleifera]XP_057980294.1 F-box protein SKIP23-like [Malania oleifera]XP_057980295.1 F-box protein SKIP23-like [Malania oleifera]XP_057980296.1 F-box protein SKIP23-like [Malania oleifera]